ncbi:MAG: hypothetical protein RL417_1059 [Pseudomonadota bacterium]
MCDRACHAADQEDLVGSEMYGVAVLRAVRLYPVVGAPVYIAPPQGIARALPESIHPFVGRVLALEGLRVLGRGEREAAFVLASEGAQIAPASIDVLKSLRTVVRDNVARGTVEDSGVFLQLERVAAAGLRFLEAAYEIKEWHAPIDLVASRERHRMRAQREIEAVVRDHVAAAERIVWHPEVSQAIALRGAQVGLAGLSLVGLPDVMAGLTDLYRREESAGIEPRTPLAKGTAALLEAIGRGYHGADKLPFAFVAFSLALRLDPDRAAVRSAVEAVRYKLRSDADRPCPDGASSEDRLAVWNSFRTREIPLGWNFSQKGSELFADAFYQARDLGAFSLEFAREVSHDYAVIDRGGAAAATTYIGAIPQIVTELSRRSAPVATVFAEALRAQSLLRYIDLHTALPREIAKPAYRLGAELEALATELAVELPPGALERAEAFFRVIRAHHSS